MAAAQALGDSQELEDDKQAVDSASFLHIQASHSTRLDEDDTKHSVADTVSPILPNIRDCSTRGVRPNSIPSRPNPTAGCW